MSVKSSIMKSKTDLMTDEQTDDNGILFWLNKSGFPLDNHTWDRMWSHVEKIHPDGSDVCRKIQNSSLKPVPVPQPPVSFPKMTSIPDRVDAVQKYMRDLQYNHTGTQFFEIRKNRPISGLMEVARDMIRDSLPIKCLEAIILGVYLTNGMPGVERFPISFKSTFNGNVHRHVVLGIFHGGKFGTIGMSRRDDLMYKPLHFKCLSDLIFDFHDSYRKYWHIVKKTKVGMPVPHDPHSFEQICWKMLALNVSSMSRAEIILETEKHSKEIRAQLRLRVMYDLTGHRKSKHVAVNPSSGSPRKTSLTHPSSPGKERTRVSLSRESKSMTDLTRMSVSSQLDDLTDRIADYQILI